MDPTAIREQIERILRSPSFAGKSQLRKLLEVLFTNIESQGNLNPDLVINELWPGEIRTKRSADVATEMNRLRHALDAYYAAEGGSDPIIISLPNRSAAAGTNAHEKRWIVTSLRDGAGTSAGEERPSENRQAHVRENPRRRLKFIMAIAATGVLGFVVYAAVRMLPVQQPQFGRQHGSTLTIFNAEGKELWKKRFPEGFGPDSYYGKEASTRIWFADDLEGKGRTSVLFSYLPAASSQPHSSTLICYSDRGKEKWRWTPGRDLPEVGPGATYKTFSVGVLKAAEKRSPRIVVLSNHDPWWGGPSQVAVLDSNGKTLSEYWHSGGLSDMVVADLDGDGREEIIATGVSEYDHQATLVVLDPDRVFGASTEVRPEFQIHGMGVAQERLRLLFPRSDLNRALFQFNVAMDPTVEHGSLRLTVAECITPLGCLIYYEFDKNFHLIAAYAGGDEFRSAHARFYQSGKDAHPLSAEEQAAFQKVRCLVGCKSEFVPVGNLVP